MTFAGFTRSPSYLFWRNTDAGERSGAPLLGSNLDTIDAHRLLLALNYDDLGSVTPSCARDVFRLRFVLLRFVRLLHCFISYAVINFNITIIQNQYAEVNRKVWRCAYYFIDFFESAWYYERQDGYSKAYYKRSRGGERYNNTFCFIQRNRFELCDLSQTLAGRAAKGRCFNARGYLLCTESEARTAIRVYGRLNSKAEVSAKPQYYSSENHSRFALLTQERRRREIHPLPKVRGLLSQLDKSRRSPSFVPRAWSTPETYANARRA